MSVADRVRETLTGATDFTGQKGASATITLPGSASSGYDPFSRRYTNGTGNIPVIIAHRSADEWQACLCTYTSSNLLTVNTIVATSEAADAAPSFTAGDKDIYVAALARNIVPATTGNTIVGNSGSGLASLSANTAITVLNTATNTLDFARLDGVAASSHTHGNITNAGAIGSTANLPVITTTSGVLTTGTFGTGANTFAQGNDSRLSDTRTPTDGTVSTAKIQDGAVSNAKIANMAANTIKGNATGGSAAPTDLAASDVIGVINTASTGTLNVARGGTGASTLTGVVKGTGTSALTASAIVNADVTSTFADGIESSKLRFTQSGSGAVARSVDAKLKDVVSVFDFMTAAEITDVTTRARSVNVRAAISAAITAAAGKTLFFPKGDYRIETAGGTLTLANICLQGEGPNEFGDAFDATSSSMLCIYDTTNSAFTVGRGVSIDGLSFLYPAVVENNTTPTAYPALLTGTFLAQFTFTNNTVMNCYRFLEIPQNGKAGDCRITNNRIFAIDRYFSFIGGVPEAFFINDNLFTFGVYESQVTGQATFAMRNYHTANGEWMRVDCGAGTLHTSVDGINAHNNLIFGCRYGIRVQTGRLDVSVINGNKFDAVPTAIAVLNTGTLVNTTISSNLFYSYRFADTAAKEACVYFFSSGDTSSFNLSCNFFAYAQGDAVAIVGTTDIDDFSITGNHFRLWGQTTFTPTTGYRAIAINDADAWGSICNNMFYGNPAGSNAALGLVIGNIRDVLVSGNHFNTCYYAIEIVEATNACVSDNFSVNTVHSVADIMSSVTGTLRTSGNNFDKPSATVGNRIRCDFSNATQIQRSVFQTSTTNGNTGLFAVPNGTSTTSNIAFTNAADPTNCGFMQIGMFNDEARIVSGVLGSGTQRPMVFTVGSERMRLDNSGNLGLNTTSFGTSAAGVLAIANGTAPSTSPANVGQLYVDGGALKFRGAGGNVTTFASASTDASAFASPVTVEASSGTALTVTNTGSGASFRVNDVAGDSSPFLIDADGRVYIGRTSAFAGGRLEIQDDSTNSHLAMVSVSDTIRPTTVYARYRAGAAAVQNGDEIAKWDFRGNNSGLKDAASVSVFVDAAPGASDMPGRIIFSTSAVGSATPTERVRIKSGGQVRFVPLTADPAGAEDGDVYYNSSTNKLRVRANGSWVDLH